MGGGNDHGSTDVLIVGGGPAGMSAAINLARYNRSVVVFDTGHGRSTHHQTNRNYLGFPDGIKTTELRERARQQLAHYPHAHVLHHKVDRLAGDADAGFVAHYEGGTWHGRALILATGVLDHYPHFPGWEEYVGISMFWCIACDGYENRGRNLLAVGHTGAAAEEALQLHSLTDRIRLLTNSHEHDISPTWEKRLLNAGIEVIHDKLARGFGADGQLTHVETQGGRRIDLDAMFSIQGATPETSLAVGLGVELSRAGYVKIDTEQKTTVPGVYAAGDITVLHSHQVSAAVHEGATAASAANWFLYPPELKVV